MREGVAHGGVPGRQECRAFEGDGAAGPHGEDIPAFVLGVAEVEKLSRMARVAVGGDFGSRRGSGHRIRRL